MIVKDDLKTDLLELIPLTFGNKLTVSKLSPSVNGFQNQVPYYFQFSKVSFPILPENNTIAVIMNRYVMHYFTKNVFRIFFPIFWNFLNGKTRFLLQTFH